jgi:peptidoglycan/xylan/chitin deacetylase (PgdA/CDA1 family)
VTRELRGYAGKYPKVKWPKNARVAVSVVLNIEEGAELLVSAGDERNETIYEAIQKIEGAPDLALESHFEYGARVGYWRIADAADAARVPLTLNACARALEATPWIGEDGVKRGYGLQCHGWRWEAHAGMEEKKERALIQKCVETFRRVCGRAPAGWHTKSSASVNTRRLVAEAGFLYDSDAYNDDAPYYAQVAGRPHLVLPYSFETNDMRFWDGYAFVRGADFAEYCMDAYERLWKEGKDAPRMLSIGLHTRIIGRAARISGLELLLKKIKSKGGAWFATREQIARHWLKACPPK